MKKLTLLLFVVFILCNYSRAQCDKKIVWTSVKEEFFDANGAVEQAHEDSVTIETSNTGIILNHDNVAEEELKGAIENINCNWTEPYKNGKTIIKTHLTASNGESNDGLITIEGKDGQIIIIADIGGKQIRIYVAKYEEKG